VDTLTVEVGERRLALRSSDVREVVELSSITPVPLGPAMLTGLTQVRGQVVPVIDLADPPRTPRPSDCLVLVEAGSARAALRVDRVVGLEPAESTPPLDVGAVFETLRSAVAAARAALGPPFSGSARPA
jgi:purine-binding chemotaxis protein CheW